jgi:hypothetical protein
MQRLAAMLICLALSGCTGMPDKKVEGLDGLKVTEHVLSQSEVMSVCGQKLGIPALMRLFVTPLACATIWLEKWTCNIYYSEATAKYTLEHERKHCQGYWHDDGLEKYRDRWLAAKKSAQQ